MNGNGDVKERLGFCPIKSILKTYTNIYLTLKIRLATEAVDVDIFYLNTSLLKLHDILLFFYFTFYNLHNKSHTTKKCSCI